MTPPFMITRADELDAAVRRWTGADEIALDTEFVFERTYRPRLGLVQVAAGREIALLDAVALPDLAPLAPLLEAPGTRKLLHAGAGDIAVLRRATGVAPRPLLDTQIAAAFAGLGASLSYAALVAALEGVDLPKHETRTDWLRRPLSPEQIRYAAEDVEHLPAVARELERRLAGLGRLAWAEQDSAEVAADTGETPPAEAWRRLRGLERLPPRNRRIARALAAWREREAERLDLARPFLLRDETLVALARRGAVRPADVAKLPGYDARRHAGHVTAWFAALDEARQAAEGDEEVELDERPPLPVDVLEAAGHAVAEAVARHAAALELAPELLLSRRQRDRLLRAWDGRSLLSAGLAGWRRDLFGADLDRAAAGA